MIKELRKVTVKDIRKLTDIIKDSLFDICYLDEYIENKINKGLIKSLKEKFPTEINEYKTLYEFDGHSLVNWIEKQVEDKTNLPDKYIEMYEIIFNYDKVCNNDFWYAYEEELE